MRFSALGGLTSGLFAISMLVGCDDKVDWDNGSEPEPVEPPRVIRPIDTTPSPASMAIPDEVARYRGQAVIVEEAPLLYNQTGIAFDPESGPRCISGGDYRITVRDGQVNKLHIFLQGGGACWSEVCMRTDGSAYGMPHMVMNVLSDREDFNPMFAYNTVYMPYCDGSLFIGDIDYDDNEDGELDRFHRGLQNLTAAIDVAVERWGEPDEIVLSGLSAGGYGTIFASLLTRKTYPNVPIRIFNDSGVGITRGENDPEFLRRLVDEWNAGELIPESCGDCLDGGHFISFIRWVLANDDDLKMSSFSYDRDSTIADSFMGVGGDFFRAELLRLLPELEADFPDQYRYAILPGDGHTTLGGIAGTRVEGVRLADWIFAMLNGSEAWVSLFEE